MWIPAAYPPLSSRSVSTGVCMALIACAALAAPARAGIVMQEVPHFPSTNRPDVRGTMGAVSSDHPLATAAGLQVLREGGNAVDAAIAMAGVLAVVRPHMNGVGGDAFGLFYQAETGEVHALNGSGRAGTLATRDFFIGQGLTVIPETGPLSVSVPGTVAAWEDALDRFGTGSMEDLLAPAVRYARDGFPVSQRLHDDISGASGPLNDAARELYLPGGEAVAVGSLLRNPALARTLEAIGRGGAHAFYQGAPAHSISAYLEAEGGYLRSADFAAHTSSWVAPLTGEYQGHLLHVMPPNTQGVAQLQLTEMAKSFRLKEMGHNTSSYLHTLIELKKLAFADRDRWVADPEFAEIPLGALLDPTYLEKRARLVRADRALEHVASGLDAARTEEGGEFEGSGDTVYLTAVDQWGNAVSWIQSLFHSFGSGILEPESGVVLQDRGALFSLQEGHPNVVEPGKRPYHTLTPLLALRDGNLAFTLGTPGGDSQTQSILQIMNNVFLFGMSPQAAIEAPRFRGYGGLRVDMEDRIERHVIRELSALGHDISLVSGWTATFGGAQMILFDPVSGTLVAAADPRREAYALAY